MILAAAACRATDREPKNNNRPAGETPLSIVHRSLGCFFSIQIFDKIESDAEKKIAAEIVAILDQVEGATSVWEPSSEISWMNRAFENASATFQPSEMLWELLNICESQNRRTGGLFDITIGPLVEAYGLRTEHPAVPSPEIRATLQKRVGFQHLQFDRANRKVTTDSAGVALDLDGVNKGYAVDRIVKMLTARGIQDATVDAGGSTIFSIGPPAGRPPRKFGIANPNGEMVTFVELRNTALSTSGNWRRGALGHLLNPRTGELVHNQITSATVVTKTAVDSDALAKPVVILGLPGAAELLAGQFLEIVILQKEPDGEGISVRRVGR